MHSLHIFRNRLDDIKFVNYQNFDHVICFCCSFCVCEESFNSSDCRVTLAWYLAEQSAPDCFVLSWVVVTCCLASSCHWLFTGIIGCSAAAADRGHWLLQHLTAYRPWRQSDCTVKKALSCLELTICKGDYCIAFILSIGFSASWPPGQILWSLQYYRSIVFFYLLNSFLIFSHFCSKSSGFLEEEDDDIVGVLGMRFGIGACCCFCLITSGVSSARMFWRSSASDSK